MRFLSGTAHSQSQHQRGQTITEYLIILPVLLLLILGVIQYAFIYQAKISLNYATFMGARQGALKNANLTSIKDGVAAGMTPFFMRTNTAPSLSTLGIARAVSMIEIFNPGTAKVEIISPEPYSVADYSEDADDPSIPNDNLMFRQSSAAEGHLTIQDANLLKIRVTYCVKLNVPVVNRVIYAISAGITGIKNLANESFWDSASEGTPNELCSMTNDLWAPLRTTVNDQVAAQLDKIPTEFSSTTSDTIGQVKTYLGNLTGKAIDKLPQKVPRIPVLDWDINGMRIPITAEAIIRMQSPVKF